MNRLTDFDDMARWIISVLYRFVLLFYGVCVLCFFDNYFPYYFYIASTTTYVGLSLFLIFKKSAFLKTRLILDYSLIFVVLYLKPIDNLVCIVFLLVPIFNTPNFSGRRRSYFILYSVPIVSYFILNRYKFQWIIIIPFFSLFVISYLEYIRSKAFNFYYALTSSINEFYDTRRESGRDYKIYESLIKKFNRNKFSSVCTVDAICCLQLKGGNYFIQNSSNLFFDIEIVDLPEFIKKINLKEVFSSNKISIDGRTSEFNLIVPIPKEEGYSVFVIMGTRSLNLINSVPFIRDKFFLNPFLIPFFTQLSHFFDTESKFRKNRIKKFEKISNEYEYVLRTINAVHFIRNRLTPFKNYLAMTSDLYEPNIYEKNVKKKLEEIVIDENAKSQTTLAEILARVKQILEEGDNPFNVTRDILPLEIKMILSDVQGILSEVMGSVHIDNQVDASELTRKVALSHKGINIIISDIIGNIQKHSNENYKVVFIIENEKLILKFHNKFDSSSSNLHKLKELVAYFASKENYNIFKMSSKGAFLIKDFSKQMDIEVLTSISESNSNFSIELLINLIP